MPAMSGFVLKAFFSIERLLACRKSELLTAILADENFVLKHRSIPFIKN
jgi:hypothetical protein